MQRNIVESQRNRCCGACALSGEIKEAVALWGAVWLEFIAKTANLVRAGKSNRDSCKVRRHRTWVCHRERRNVPAEKAHVNQPETDSRRWGSSSGPGHDVLSVPAVYPPDMGSLRAQIMPFISWFLLPRGPLGACHRACASKQPSNKQT